MGNKQKLKRKFKNLKIMILVPHPLQHHLHIIELPLMLFIKKISIYIKT